MLACILVEENEILSFCNVFMLWLYDMYIRISWCKLRLFLVEFASMGQALENMNLTRNMLIHLNVITSWIHVETNNLLKWYESCEIKIKCYSWRKLVGCCNWMEPELVALVRLGRNWWFHHLKGKRIEVGITTFNRKKVGKVECDCDFKLWWDKFSYEE